MTFRISLAAIALVGCNVGPGRLVDTRSATLDASAIDLLEIYAGPGDLEVMGCEGCATIDAAVELYTLRPGRGADGDAMDALLFELEDRGNGVARLRAEFAGEPDGYTADAVVSLPLDLLVQIDDGDGDLLVDGVARLDLTDEGGDVEIARVTGDVFVQDDSGDIVVHGVDGDVDIDDGDGDIDVRNVGGQVTIRDGGGDILVEDAGGIAILEDGSGEVVIR